MEDLLLSNTQIMNDLKLKNREDSFESESTTSNSDVSTNQNSLDFLPNDIIPNLLKTLNPIINISKQPKAEKSDSFSFWKFFLVALGIFLMFSARFNVPANDVKNLQDNVLDFFLPINNWIHSNSHTAGPKILLFACATNMDLIFFVTVCYWFRYGTSGRLPFALSVFYLVRTLVQQMSFQPYPVGYYWDSPGFPSFVAPYGRSTDFFFSGHSGFLVLMANEWGKNGYKWVQRYVQLNLVYTIFVLLACQAHYSIDIFTGVFFADYVFGKVDQNKDAIDGFFGKIARLIESPFGKFFGRKGEKVEKRE